MKARTRKARTTKLVFETSDRGLAQQVAKAIKKTAKRPKRGPKGRRSPYDGWQQDKGPSGPWGQSFTWAQETHPPWNQASWSQSTVRRKPRKRPKLINPVRKTKKAKSVRAALRKAQVRHR